MLPAKIRVFVSIVNLLRRVGKRYYKEVLNKNQNA